jgi:hypothetical protein
LHAHLNKNYLLSTVMYIAPPLFALQFSMRHAPFMEIAMLGLGKSVLLKLIAPPFLSETQFKRKASTKVISVAGGVIAMQPPFSLLNPFSSVRPLIVILRPVIWK